MKRIIFAIAALLLSVSMMAQDKTLRIDYIFSGTDKTQEIALDEMSSFDGWAGRRVNMDEVPVTGNGQIVMTAKESGEVLYRQSFSTLFQEWQTTEEATRVRKSFENVFLLPMPSVKAEVRIELYGFKGGISASMTHEVDPSDILIRQIAPQPAPHKYILENGSASGLIESYNTYKSVKKNVDNLFSSLLSGTSSPEYAVKLIGLGRGLTPSGDDFLAGMFSLFFAAEKCGIKVPAALCDYALAVRENIGRTSKISGAYLLSVLDKKRFSLYENACLALLGEGDIKAFANEVLPLGASSGTDTLCGALFAAKAIERI